MGKANDAKAAEDARVATLRRLATDFQEREWPFDALAALVSHILGTPMAALTLLDDQRQWVKSSLGTTEGNVPRNFAFCNETIKQHDVLMVEDATSDERFKESPLVTDDPKIKFYAGAPVWVEGHNIGAVCGMDRRSKQITKDQERCLLLVANVAAQLLVLERDLREARMKINELEQAKAA